MRKHIDVDHANKEILGNNKELLAIIREKEKIMTEVRDHMKKQDFSLMSYSHKDLTLQIMNIKIEQINAFFLNLLKKLTLQQEKEKENYKRQLAAVGETIKNSIVKDPNFLMQIKTSSRIELTSAKRVGRDDQ